MDYPHQIFFVSFYILMVSSSYLSCNFRTTLPNAGDFSFAPIPDLNFIRPTGKNIFIFAPHFCKQSCNWRVVKNPIGHRKNISLRAILYVRTALSKNRCFCENGGFIQILRYCVQSANRPSVSIVS